MNRMRVARQALEVNGTSIGDARFEPFFAAAEELGAAVCVHDPAGQDRVSCASMITGGVAADHHFTISAQNARRFLGLK